MLPQDDATEVQNQVRLVGAGLRSHRSAMDALGTENPEEELARVQADRAALGDRPHPGPSPARRGESRTALTPALSQRERGLYEGA